MEVLMKTKMLLQTTGLTILMMLLTTLYSNAQIPIQGLEADHEGIAVWDADGSGPEPEGYGHTYPSGISVGYYGASRDYAGIDADPDAALCHFLDNITGFPLFVQALADNGFTAGQVKVKTSLFGLKDDIEGEDWFNIGNMHYFNRYDGYYFIELNGEPMISGYLYYIHCPVPSTGPAQCKSSFSCPVNASENSSLEVQDVAAAFLTDMDGMELRLVLTDLLSTGTTFNGNGRLNTNFINIGSGYLEKGLPELPFTGLDADHEGIAGWNADGSGPEPEAYGHTYNYGGNTFSWPYYLASYDYDSIDPDPNAALCHLTDTAIGLPNLEVQLDYLGYTMDQLKAKSNIATMGNDIQGIDWDVVGSIHWYHTYGCTVTIEIAGEPIIKYVIDTNFCSEDLANLNESWTSYSTYSIPVDISANASGDAQQVAASLLKDFRGRSIKTCLEGPHDVEPMNQANGRVQGFFYEVESCKLEGKLPSGTHIWENEVSGTWDVEGSPYIVMGELKVPDGEMLIIDTGVVVKFNTTEMLSINGCIKAIGTPEEPILFTALDNSVRWGGIIWDQTPVTNETSILKHCIFEYAYAYNYDNIFSYNSGGAIAVFNYEQIEISHCLFRYNLADKPGVQSPAGGAIGVLESSLYISHCIFHDNYAEHGGAIALANESNAIFDNCLFYNNEAISWYGGAVLTYSDCSPTFINCTFADNYALQGGGAAELELGGTATFTNCILWGNTAGSGVSQISIWDPDISFLNIYYSDVDDSLNGITPFQGDTLNIIEVDPEFMGTGDFPFALQDASPCVNYGTQNTNYLPQGYDFPDYCLMGNPRIYGYAIDLGCYESLITGYNKFENLEAFSISVFPNPINSKPIIEFYLQNYSQVNLTVLDITGRVVFEPLTRELQSGKNQLTLNTENLSPGVYFCRLQVGEEVLTRKIIKL